MAISDALVTDDLTVVLGLVAVCLFMLHNLYRPQSLVHPILLGRQSDVARVRNPGESAAYRNYSTGMLGRFPARPTRDQQLLMDLVPASVDAPRTLWATKITNSELRERASAFATGLVRIANLRSQDSNVLMLLNDGIEFVVTDLALASASIPSLVLTSLSFLSPVLETHPPAAIITHADLLPHLLELIYDSLESDHHTIIVVGDFKSNIADSLHQIKLLRWDDIEREGARGDKVTFSDPRPEDVFSVSFFASQSGELQGAQLTHENLTAGVAAIRALVPLSGAMSQLDTLVSAFPLNTPYGRAVAYTALYEGANFATLDCTKLVPARESEIPALVDLGSGSSYPIPSPTILFLKPSHLSALSTSIIQEARSSSPLLYYLAWRQKMAGMLEGYITKQSLWDRLVFDEARSKVMGRGAGAVRAVVVGGAPLEAQVLVLSRIAVSVPLVNVYVHPLVAGPVFASHPLDLQTFPTPSDTLSSMSAADAFAFTYVAPVGPPAINLEAKLVSVNDAAVEGGADPVGSVLVRGPVVGKLLRPQDEQEDGEADWVALGKRAKVAANGAFKVVENQSGK